MLAMAVLRRAGASVLIAALAMPATAGAAGNCTTLDVDFLPAAQAGNPFPLQMVAWLELPDGTYKHTMFITQRTGTFGIGNRPGRFDFNSGPNWPYGRRITVFPVWARRHGFVWPEIVFQNGDDSNLSHPFNDSSREPHFCRPLQPPPSPDEELWDAQTCASTVFTDKGVLQPGSTTSLYPPRNDIARATPDDPTVDMFAMLNPFDAVSQATPPSGTPATFSFAVPEDLPSGDYVMFVEVSREFDMNASYNAQLFPSPINIPFDNYGEPYRGQPSVLYRVPFTILEQTESTATTSEYIGYGDPDGLDGNIRAPDNTITLDVPGSGATRLQLLSNDGSVYRLRLVSKPQIDFDPPTFPANLQVVSANSNQATLAFVAPGDDGTTGKAAKYEVRYLAGTDLTTENFETATLAPVSVQPVAGGSVQSFVIAGLLPETDYSVGIRAVDDCRNVGELSILSFTTPEREAGNVDACFIATAAYGSAMANDVDMLRRFRDALLRRTVLGELAIEAYYTFSPALSNVIGESDLLRHTARDLLAPIVAKVRGLQIEPPR
jgi:hypothetical protein